MNDASSFFSPKNSCDIAIDPAGAMFTYPNLVEKSERVDPGDARYVQAIHTSIVLGSGVEAGHADFYIDGGVSQPGCATEFLRKGLLGMFRLHIEIVSNEYKFQIRKKKKKNKRIHSFHCIFIAEIPTICNHFRAVEIFQLSLNPQNTERIIGVSQSRNCAIQSQQRLRTDYCESAVESLGIHNHRRIGRFDLSTVRRFTL